MGTQMYIELCGFGTEAIISHSYAHSQSLFSNWRGTSIVLLTPCGSVLLSSVPRGSKSATQSWELQCTSSWGLTSLVLLTPGGPALLYPT